MNKRIDFSNIGGFPLEQDTLDFMQTSYRGALGAIAKLCGNKVIVTGVENDGADNISDGWIVVDGELVPFVGGPLDTYVVISETPGNAEFEDGNVKEVYYTKTATCGATGDFVFAELVPLLSLQNTWRPNDLKQKYVDNAYIAANFDVDGYGINDEKGWRILSAAVPGAAGKVFVNRDSGDADFDETGNTGGTKTHTITRGQLPAFKLKVPLPTTNINGAKYENESLDSGSSRGLYKGKAINNGDPLTYNESEDLGSGQSFNKMNPYFVVLTLIKL